MYRNLLKTLLFALMTSVLLIGCQKESILESTEHLKNNVGLRSERQGSHLFDNHEGDLSQTVLGDKIENPYSIKNLLIALDSLCGHQDSVRANIATSHKSVKFSPNSYEELKLLVSDSTFSLYDFPYDYQVIEMGDFFVDPQEVDGIPSFYSMIEIDQQIPSDLNYEYLEDYAFNIDNPVVLAESFRLTGHTHLINEYVEFSEESMSNIPICINVLPPTLDECSCNPILYPKIITQEGIFYDWKCPCNDPAIPNCVDPCYLVFEGTNYDVYPPVEVWDCDCPLEPAPSGPALLNDCGCPVYSDQRKPGGCINVENNSTNNLDGVNTVKVIVRDYRFGNDHITWTTERGCWRINESFKGRIWMWVEFTNGDSYERCYRNNVSIWQLLLPVKDYVGEIWGPNYNDIEVIYWHWGNQTETQAQRYWGAATVNNEVQIYLGQTGDLAQPPRLDIYLTPNERRGAAMMGMWPNAVSQALIPDVAIGIDFQTRDALDRLSYHELAHTGHFSQVGFAWWSDLIDQEVANSIEFGNGPNGITFTFDGDPWGQGDEPNAGHVALAESWADNVMTDIMGDDQEGLVFENGYIPMGLYEDLEDNVQDIIRLGIRDRITGYTREEMFNSLNVNITTLNEYQQDLQGALPASNNLVDYNDLFTAYTP